MSLNMESAWTERKAPISKKIRKLFLVVFQFLFFSYGPCSFQMEWHIRLKFFLELFYRCSFDLVPKASWAITHLWLQLSYSYSYTRCFGCSFINVNFYQQVFLLMILYSLLKITENFCFIITYISK